MKIAVVFFLALLFLTIITTSLWPEDSKKLQVVCTIPTLKALTEEVGGDRIDAISLAKRGQDPHFVTPTPVLIKKTRDADLFIENGFLLEPWADAVVDESGNAKIFRGAPGRVIAGSGISLLEVPLIVSHQSVAYLHPRGNPHFWLDPLLAKVEAANICEALKAADPVNAQYYEARKNDFNNRIDNALFGPELLKLVGIQKLTVLAESDKLYEFLESNKIGALPLSAMAGGWLKAAESLQGVKAYEFHKEWVYFARIFGIRLLETIEERPGFPPGPQRIQDLVGRIKAEKIPIILVDTFYEPSLTKNIARETGAAVVLLPNQVEQDTSIKTYFDLIDQLIRKITAGLTMSTNK